MNTLGLLLRRNNTRRQYRKKVHLHATKDMQKRLILFACVIGLHSLAMNHFEHLNWWQAFWLTMTSASTTGYGDLSPATFWGQFSTIVLIYGIGITLLAQIASDYVELRISKKEMRIKGHMEWNKMQDHLLIINTPSSDASRYLKLLVSQVCNTPELSEVPIQILTKAYPDGLPMSLRSRGVVHHTGEATKEGKLLSAGANKAKYVIVLCSDPHDGHCDSQTFDILHRLKEIGCSAFILAEAIDDSNRQRFRNAGAKAVIRPMRAYPEMLVRSLIAPGTEQVLENLFRYEGDHTIRLEVNLEGFTWAQIVTCLIQNNIGTALGYENQHGQIITHPSTTESIHARSLILLVGDELKTPSPEQLLSFFENVA
ncbi:voltage-gated potassium channel [Marinomonas spartinae]|uniref:Voltage-gated potassium channel n=1 Tax=Marinomonas spartinae TaxID=1792290 RepID=A0A1A8T4N0_9GAMM|nr:potassium channel family protein [Marinomonas spartinae]SBS26472.1 voltage-gated potassium channel [Marinomonas spartinae]SBS40168.1 voltage-gated potassium channel [Marinomonas spartinae]